MQVIASLNDEESPIRSDAASALGAIQDPRAIESLIAAWNKKALSEWEVVRALGTIKEPRVIEFLILVLKHEYEFLRKDAAEELEKITGENFGTDHKKWLK